MLITRTVTCSKMCSIEVEVIKLQILLAARPHKKTVHMLQHLIIKRLSSNPLLKIYKVENVLNIFLLSLSRVRLFDLFVSGTPRNTLEQVVVSSTSSSSSLLSLFFLSLLHWFINKWILLLCILKEALEGQILSQQLQISKKT